MIPLALLVLQTAGYRVGLDAGGEGTARLTQRARPGGGKTVLMVATLRRGAASVEVRTESVFDAVGAPLRKVQGVGPPGRPPTHETIVTFDAAGAHAVVRERGVPKATEVPLDPKRSRANAAETWFLSAKPKPGDVAKAWTFDASALEWAPTETTYVGPVPGGHLLRIARGEKRGEAVLDDAGLPVRIEEGGLRLERKAP